MGCCPASGRYFLFFRKKESNQRKNSRLGYALSKSAVLPSLCYLCIPEADFRRGFVRVCRRQVYTLAHFTNHLLTSYSSCTHKTALISRRKRNYFFTLFTSTGFAGVLPNFSTRGVVLDLAALGSAPLSINFLIVAFAIILFFRWINWRLNLRLLRNRIWL